MKSKESIDLTTFISSNVIAVTIYKALYSLHNISVSRIIKAPS